MSSWSYCILPLIRSLYFLQRIINIGFALCPAIPYIALLTVYRATACCCAAGITSPAVGFQNFHKRLSQCGRLFKLPSFCPMTSECFMKWSPFTTRQCVTSGGCDLCFWTVCCRPHGTQRQHDQSSSHCLEQNTRWFKYDRDWFVCKKAALRSSCATLREWSHNLHPPSCPG